MWQNEESEESDEQESEEKPKVNTTVSTLDEEKSESEYEVEVSVCETRGSKNTLSKTLLMIATLALLVLSAGAHQVQIQNQIMYHGAQKSHAAHVIIIPTSGDCMPPSDGMVMNARLIYTRYDEPFAVGMIICMQTKNTVYKGWPVLGSAMKNNRIRTKSAKSMKQCLLVDKTTVAVYTTLQQIVAIVHRTQMSTKVDSKEWWSDKCTQTKNMQLIKGQVAALEGTTIMSETGYFSERCTVDEMISADTELTLQNSL
jgi:hypothetical protein